MRNGATSQNGWPVLTGATAGELPRLRKFILPGTGRHLLARDGAVGFLLAHFALWWHSRLDRLDGGVWDEWGYALRPVRGQTSGYSNHASGTAVDLDATQFPRGRAIGAVFKAWQIKRIRRRLKLYGGLLGWGGNYTRTPDGMHVEVNPGVPLAACERLAVRLLTSPRGRALLEANPGLESVIRS